MKRFSLLFIGLCGGRFGLAVACGGSGGIGGKPSGGPPPTPSGGLPCPISVISGLSSGPRRIVGLCLRPNSELLLIVSSPCYYFRRSIDFPLLPKWEQL